MLIKTNELPLCQATTLEWPDLTYSNILTKTCATLILLVSVAHLTETDLVPLCLLQVDDDYDIGVVFIQLNLCEQLHPYRQCLQIRAQQQWVHVVV